MKKVLISYSDENLKASLRHVGEQARKTKLFDDIILYTPEMLPNYIKHSPLMTYKRGGGYWCWKPAIIFETLQKFEEDTIVVYVDAGCVINKSPEWELFFELMKRYDTLIFQYRDIVLEWEQFGQTSTEIQYWTKRSCVNFMDQYINDDSWHHFKKCLGSFIICKGRNNKFIQKWLDVTINHWEQIKDPEDAEMTDQIEGFAYHKHDQSIITPLAWKEKDSVMILPEMCESCGRYVAVHTSRIRAKNEIEYYTILFKQVLREKMGDKAFELCKSILGISNKSR